MTRSNACAQRAGDDREGPATRWRAASNRGRTTATAAARAPGYDKVRRVSPRGSIRVSRVPRSGRLRRTSGRGTGWTSRQARSTRRSSGPKASPASRATCPQDACPRLRRRRGGHLVARGSSGPGRDSGNGADGQHGTFVRHQRRRPAPRRAPRSSPTRPGVRSSLGHAASRPRPGRRPPRPSAPRVVRRAGSRTISRRNRPFSRGPSSTQPVPARIAWAPAWSASSASSICRSRPVGRPQSEMRNVMSDGCSIS